MKVTLLKAHTHAGVNYDAGVEIDVDESDANWLINLKIAEAAQAKTSAVAVPAKKNDVEVK